MPVLLPIYKGLAPNLSDRDGDWAGESASLARLAELHSQDSTGHCHTCRERWPCETLDLAADAASALYHTLNETCAEHERQCDNAYEDGYREGRSAALADVEFIARQGEGASVA